jgi:O-antigen/teichoic acid export membrane protein
VGLYTFTIGLLQKPTKMIGQAVSQVFYQNASLKVANNESIYKDTLRLVKNLGLIGGIVFLPILLLGPYFFSFVFGDKWWDAGVIAQIIAPWFFLRFIASPLANLAMIMKKQKQFLYITMAMNILLPFIFFSVGFFKLDYTLAFIIASSFMFLYLLVTLRWVIGFTK